MATVMMPTAMSVFDCVEFSAYILLLQSVLLSRPDDTGSGIGDHSCFFNWITLATIAMSPSLHVTGYTFNI